MCNPEHLFPILGFSFINHKMNNLNFIFSLTLEERELDHSLWIHSKIYHSFQGTELIFIISWPYHKVFSMLFQNEHGTCFMLRACCVLVPWLKKLFLTVYSLNKISKIFVVNLPFSFTLRKWFDFTNHIFILLHKTMCLSLCIIKVCREQKRNTKVKVSTCWACHQFLQKPSTGQATVLFMNQPLTWTRLGVNRFISWFTLQTFKLIQRFNHSLYNGHKWVLRFPVLALRC